MKLVYKPMTNSRRCGRCRTKWDAAVYGRKCPSCMRVNAPTLSYCGRNEVEK